jgi:excinuclease ABC subunit C
MRINSYFQKSSFSAAKIKMLTEAAKISWQKTESEIDALILESKLIKKHQPKYNILMRDDKQYFYVKSTAEKFPKITITHQPFAKQSIKSKNDYIGPFTDGVALKTTLKILRKIFPFCVCKVLHKRPCQQFQIKKCFGICCIKPSLSEKYFKLKKSAEKIKEYKKNVKTILDILKGKKQSVKRNLKKKLQNLIKNQEYEKAEDIHKKILALEKIFKHKPFLSRDAESNAQKALKYLKNIIKSKEIRRIEAYDISNIKGKNAAGSMAVFENNEIKKSDYRHFKIKTIQLANDSAMIKEVLTRRLKRREWPAPDLILIDGGKAQLNAASKAVSSRNIKIAALAKAKNGEILFLKNKKIEAKNMPPPLLFFLQNIRNEAHRFAILRHKKLRAKSLFGSN